MRTSRWVSVGLALTLSIVPLTVGGQPRVKDGLLEVRLNDLDGNEVSLSDERFDGKVLLVALWGTWCPPCISEIPTLVEFQQRYAERGLVIVAIAFEADAEPEPRRANLAEFVDRQGINYLVLDGGPPEDFGTTFPMIENVRGFPIEIFVGRDGTVVEARNSSGFKKSWVKKLTRDIEALLSATE